MAAPKIEIRSLSKDQLTEQVLAMNEKKFRSNQLFEWLWKKTTTDFDLMSNLPKDLRSKLNSKFTINPVVTDALQKSTDGTIKCRFKLFDGELVEGVLIPAENRMTACISSQAGCNLGCRFCATGYMRTKRNLSDYEIFDQVVLLNKTALEHYKMPVSNIVFMGMGEPLLNYKNVLAGIEKITSEEGLHMSPKRITVSTAGISKMIRKLGDDKVKFNLALSLHAADDKKRSELMPINETNPINDLVDALNYFYDKTENKITFEYILFDGLNEGMDDARNLVKLCKRVPAKINIIEYNTIREADYKKSDEDHREKFIQYLEDHGVVAKVRRSRGKDIDAACGQLANVK